MKKLFVRFHDRFIPSSINEEQPPIQQKQNTIFLMNQHDHEQETKSRSRKWRQRLSSISTISLRRHSHHHHRNSKPIFYSSSTPCFDQKDQKVHEHRRSTIQSSHRHNLQYPVAAAAAAAAATDEAIIQDEEEHPFNNNDELKEPHRPFSCVPVVGHTHGLNSNNSMDNISVPEIAHVLRNSIDFDDDSFISFRRGDDNISIRTSNTSPSSNPGSPKTLFPLIIDNNSDHNKGYNSKNGIQPECYNFKKNDDLKTTKEGRSSDINNSDETNAINVLHLHACNSAAPPLTQNATAKIHVLGHGDTDYNPNQSSCKISDSMNLILQQQKGEDTLVHKKDDQCNNNDNDNNNDNNNNATTAKLNTQQSTLHDCYYGIDNIISYQQKNTATPCNSIDNPKSKNDSMVALLTTKHHHIVTTQDDAIIQDRKRNREIDTASEGQGKQGTRLTDKNNIASTLLVTTQVDKIIMEMTFTKKLNDIFNENVLLKDKIQKMEEEYQQQQRVKSIHHSNNNHSNTKMINKMSGPTTTTTYKDQDELLRTHTLAQLGLIEYLEGEDDLGSALERFKKQLETELSDSNNKKQQQQE